MAKSILKSLVFSLLLMCIFTVNVYADIAPDPVTRAIGLLPVVLIAAVVIVAAVFLIKLFGK